MNNFDDIDELCIDDLQFNDILDDLQFEDDKELSIEDNILIDESMINDISPQFNTLQQVINKLKEIKKENVYKYKQLLHEFTRNFDKYNTLLSNDVVLDDNLMNIIKLLNNKNE